MPEAIADQFGEADLGGVHAADARVVRQSLGDSSMYALFAVAQQPGRVIADQVDVGVSVGISQRAAVTADERQRKGGVVQDGSRAPAGEHGAGAFVLRTRLRVAVGGVSSETFHHRHKSTLCGH